MRIISIGQSGSQSYTITVPSGLNHNRFSSSPRPIIMTAADTSDANNNHHDQDNVMSKSYPPQQSSPPLPTNHNVWRESRDDTHICQKLIQMSFAKIVGSKATRGGAKLHKNLLVLHVLQRARHEHRRSLDSLTSALPDTDCDAQSPSGSQHDSDDVPVMTSSTEDHVPTSEELEIESLNEAGQSNVDHKLLDNHHDADGDEEEVEVVIELSVRSVDGQTPTNSDLIVAGSSSGNVSVIESAGPSSSTDTMSSPSPSPPPSPPISPPNGCGESRGRKRKCSQSHSGCGTGTSSIPSNNAGQCIQYVPQSSTPSSTTTPVVECKRAALDHQQLTGLISVFNSGLAGVGCNRQSSVDLSSSVGQSSGSQPTNDSHGMTSSLSCPSLPQLACTS